MKIQKYQSTFQNYNHQKVIVVVTHKKVVVLQYSTHEEDGGCPSIL